MPRLEEFGFLINVLPPRGDGSHQEQTVTRAGAALNAVAE